MSKVALSLAVLASLAAGASAQNYPVPFVYATKTKTVNTPSPYIAPRYLKLDVVDVDSLPDSLVTWYNTAFAPYWGMGTDFTSVPEFMASQLYVPTTDPNGVYIDTTGVPTTGQVRWVLKAPWKPPYARSSNGYFYNDQGSNYWVVVVKQDSGGNYSLLPGVGGGGTPSFYGTGTYDTAHNNTQSGLLGTKVIDFYNSESILSSVGAVNKYYVMLCNYSNYPPYTGITVRDAVLVTTTWSSQPITGPAPDPRIQPSGAPKR